MQMFSPFSPVSRGKPDPAPETERAQSSEVDDLKREMDAMRRQLSELSQRK
jgi:polyhydroxyalkanoate synthesis regulator protein